MPVLSTTTSTFMSFQGSSAGFRTARARIFLPSTIRFSLSWLTVPGKRRCVLSYLSSVASILLSVRSLIATTSNSPLRAYRLRNVNRPIRPNPLMATRIATFHSLRIDTNALRNQPQIIPAAERSNNRPELAGNDPLGGDTGGDRIDESAFAADAHRQLHRRVAAGSA